MPFINAMSYVLAVCSGLFILVWMIPNSPAENLAIRMGRARVVYSRLFIAIAIFITSLTWIFTMTGK